MVRNLILLVSSLGFSFMSSNPIKQLPKDLRDQFVYIPSGVSIIDGDSFEVRQFFGAKYEVTNLEYRRFLFAQNKSASVDAFAIDSAGWLTLPGYTEPIAKVYHRHPAFDNYPVVNISRGAAEEYCKWYQSELSKQFPDLKINVKLPIRAAWLRMSMPYHRSVAYAWGGQKLTNKKGCVLANFKNFGAENIRFDFSKEKYEVVGSPADTDKFLYPVDSYAAGRSGQYNLNGNAAEMTSDGFACGGSWNSTGYDIRNESAFEFSGSSPEVGFRVILLVGGG